VMGWPGLGPLLLEATFARDHHVVVGVVVASAAMVWLANLASDVMLRIADPRVRMGDR
jgi:peptide/nickel transport system permease protein